MKPIYQVQDIISLKEKGLKIIDCYEDNERGFLFDLDTNGLYQQLDFHADRMLEEDKEKINPYYALVPSHIYPLGLSFETRQKVIEDYHERDGIAVGEFIFLQHFGFGLEMTNGRLVECMKPNFQYIWLHGDEEDMVLFAGAVPKENELLQEGQLIQFNNSAYIPTEIPYYSYGTYIGESDSPFEKMVQSDATEKTYKLETEAFYYINEKVEALYL